MYEEYRRQQRQRRKPVRRYVITALAVVALAIVIVPLFFMLIQYLEVREIGANYTRVLITNFWVKIIAQVFILIIIFSIILIDTLLIRKNILKRDPTISFLKNPLVIILSSLIFTLLLSWTISNSLYPKWLMFANSTPFNMSDPVFDKDIGYFLFQRPFLIALFDTILGFALLRIFYCAISYAVLYAKVDLLTFSDIFRDRRILRHNIVNFVIYFIFKALAYGINSEDIVYSSIGEVAGAGFTEIEVWLRYYRIAPYLLIAIVVATIALLLKNKFKLAIAAIAVFPAFWILVSLTALFVQGIVVKPSEISMERKYIEYNIKNTAQAYGVDKIKENLFLIKNDLTLKDVKNNPNINNIRITDFNETLTATNSLQAIRNYYVFKDSDVVKYNIGGKPAAVNIAAREFDKSKVQLSARNYINQRLRYTHGYGIVMNDVSRVTEDGLPMYIIKDIPTKSFEGAPEVTQPRIYFGELTNDYVIVNTKYKELDYLTDGENVEYSYEGSAGLRMTFLNRLLFSIRNGDIMMLISGYITPESRLLINRNILERVKKAVPFLEYDSDPYLIVDSSGRLKWIVDAYTTSTYYPYSQTYDGINYIRNSAKAVVDAYDGTVNVYLTDPTDPVICTYDKIYPGVLIRGGVPEDIAEHFKYPEKLFKLQATVYSKYHMTDPEIFYGKSDLWVPAKEKYMNSEIRSVEPYYNLMQLEDTSSHELVLMLPFVPVDKENLIAWMAASYTSDGQTRLVVYKFPEGETVYGTLHIENRIDNDPNISKEISLWDSKGSNVIKGNLIIVPIKNSLVYVEPIYITSADNRAAIPEVKRIVVAYKDKVVMEPTLKKAFEVLFGAEKPTFTEESEETLSDLIDKTVKTFGEVQSYSKENDWENFGKAMKVLEDTIQKLSEKNAQTQSEQGAPSESVPQGAAGTGGLGNP